MKIQKLVVLVMLILGAFYLTSAANTKIRSAQIISSTVDSSPVGATTPSTGAFTTLTVGSGSTFTRFQYLADNTGLSCSGDQNVCNKTLTWPQAWPDSAYFVVCSPTNPSNTTGTQGLNYSGTYSQTTTSVNVAVVSSGSSSKSFGGFDCFGWHN